MWTMGVQISKADITCFRVYINPVDSVRIPLVESNNYEQWFLGSLRSPAWGPDRLRSSRSTPRKETTTSLVDLDLLLPVKIILCQRTMKIVVHDPNGTKRIYFPFSVKTFQETPWPIVKNVSVSAVTSLILLPKDVCAQQNEFYGNQIQALCE